LNLDGENIPIRAGVHNLTGYSAHADQRELLEWVRSMPKKPGCIRLVHGEPSAQAALAAHLRREGYVVGDGPLPM
jgi:metallo-beta-lactamase family protein